MRCLSSISVGLGGFRHEVLAGGGAAVSLLLSAAVDSSNDLDPSFELLTLAADIRHVIVCVLAVLALLLLFPKKELEGAAVGAFARKPNEDDVDRVREAPAALPRVCPKGN